MKTIDNNTLDTIKLSFKASANFISNCPFEDTRYKRIFINSSQEILDVLNQDFTNVELLLTKIESIKESLVFENGFMFSKKNQQKYCDLAVDLAIECITNIYNKQVTGEPFRKYLYTKKSSSQEETLIKNTKTFI
jgi:hypothetical protein